MNACAAAVPQVSDGLVPLLNRHFGEDAVRLTSPEEGTLAHTLGEYRVCCHFGQPREYVVEVAVRPQIKGAPYYEAKMVRPPLLIELGAEVSDETLRLLLGEVFYPQTQGELTDLLDAVRSDLA
jgi:hypothetical protein